MAAQDEETGLRVLLVDEDRARAALLEQALSDAGYAVIARIDTSEDLPGEVRRHQPDVIIIDIDSPDRDTLEHMHTISRDQPRPIVMFAENDDREAIHKAIKAGVSAYIVDGLSSNRVKPVMEVAIARFREYQALREELNRAKLSLEERKLIQYHGERYRLYRERVPALLPSPWRRLSTEEAESILARGRDSTAPGNLNGKDSRGL